MVLSFLIHSRVKCRRCFERYILLDISFVTYSNLGRLMQNVRTTTVTFTGIWAHTVLKPCRLSFQYVVKYSEVLENKNPDQTQHINGSCYQISLVLRLWHFSWLQLCFHTSEHPFNHKTSSRDTHFLWKSTSDMTVACLAYLGRLAEATTLKFE